jgi:hypothetical protein
VICPPEKCLGKKICQLPCPEPTICPSKEDLCTPNICPTKEDLCPPDDQKLSPLCPDGKSCQGPCPPFDPKLCPPPPKVKYILLRSVKLYYNNIILQVICPTKTDLCGPEVHEEKSFKCPMGESCQKPCPPLKNCQEVKPIFLKKVLK